jgi:hypothetical protein
MGTDWNQKTLYSIKATHNSRFSQLRILQQILIHISQEILSLTKNNRFRTSQPRQAPEH